MECGAPARTRFPDIYREFESLQGQVRQAAQDYIINPQAGPVPLEVRNIEVRSSTVFYSVIYSGCQEHSAVLYGAGYKLPVLDCAMWFWFSGLDCAVCFRLPGL